MFGNTVSTLAAHYLTSMFVIGGIALAVGLGVWGLRTAWCHFKDLGGGSVGLGSLNVSDGKGPLYTKDGHYLGG